MIVLFTCGREPQYPRNIILRACLANNNAVRDAVDSNRNGLVRYARVAFKLLSARPLPDLTCIGFFGHPLVPLVRTVMPRRMGRPVLLDAFVSVYDTICFDRRRFSPQSPAGRAAYWLDRLACELADHILLDTNAHIDYFHQTFGVPMSRMSRLFVGCDEKLFAPRPYTSGGYVLFYGSYLPLHGIDVIIRAAKLLEHDQVAFRFVGSGPQYVALRRLADNLGVRNIEYLPPVPLEALPEQIAGAAVCLGGQFAPSDKAQRVIAGKTFQCIAMARPTIVADNGANAELLTHGEDAWFCPANDPPALAASIKILLADERLSTRLGEKAAATFLERASIPVLTQQLDEILNSMVRKR